VEGHKEMKIIFYILSILLTNLVSFGKTIKVGKQYSFKTIRSAVEIAVNGDTIIVDAGYYAEKKLVINKEIYLKGINYPVLDGERVYEVVAVASNNVVIEGFKITDPGQSSTQDIAGIKLYNCKNVVIRNNILGNTVFGIYALNSSRCSIVNNLISAYGKAEQMSGNGIHCWKSDSMRIIGNNITGHRDGIYFEFVTNSVIWRNVSHNNIRYGLHFMFSHNDSYISNVFKQNGSGVAVMYSHGVKMFHNHFQENWGDAAYGLLLKEISDSYIDGNYFKKNTSGVYMEGASRISMQKNSFSDNGWAIKMQANCMDINIEQNNFISNTFDVGTNGSLVLNTFKNNYWDKYEGYDLNKDRVGDIPYRPVSMYSMIIEKNPPAMILFRSFITTLLDKSEKLIPSLTPENLKDDHPLMRPLIL
jgi:nitrous oxidase accessory protein